MSRHYYLLTALIILGCSVSLQARACTTADSFLTEETDDAIKFQIIPLNPCSDYEENHFNKEDGDGKELELDYQTPEAGGDSAEPDGYTVPAEKSLFHFE